MTLLTPAVLHSSSLEHIKDESPKFHKKYVVLFALMQGAWSVILFLICFTAILLPRAAYIRETGEEILTNASFSKISVKGDTMSVDIKPSIWAFTISDSANTRNEFVVDATGKMNRFFWDDRIEKGEIKRSNGIGITKDWFFMKNGTDIKKVQYSKLTLGKDVQFTKDELHTLLMNNTDKRNLLKYALCLIPIVFVVGSLFGALLHGLYLLVVGSLLSLLRRQSSNTVAQCYKVASGLYVAWAYVFVLLLIAQKIVYLTWANISSFFFAVDCIAFMTIFIIGYLYFQSMNTVQKVTPISKVTKKAR